MKHLLWFLLMGCALAQRPIVLNTPADKVKTALYAELPASTNTGALRYVTDCADATCSTGGGSTKLLVTYTGSAWAVVGSGTGNVTTSAALTSGKIVIGNGGVDLSVAGPSISSNDMTVPGNLTVSGTLDVVCDPGTQVCKTDMDEDAAPSSPSAGTLSVYADSTNKGLHSKDSSGNIRRDVTPTTCTAGDAVTAVTAAGAVTCTTFSTRTKQLYWVGSAGEITGTGADVDVQSYTMPSGTLAAGECLEITFTSRHTTGSASVSYTYLFGATEIQAAVASTSSATLIAQFRVCNNPGSTTAQNAAVTNLRLTTGTLSSTGVTTPAETTASSSVLIRQRFNVAATDGVTPTGMLVTRIGP